MTRDRDGYKLNNNHTAYAARDFLAEHPEHEWLFETRRAQGVAS